MAMALYCTVADVKNVLKGTDDTTDIAAMPGTPADLSEAQIRAEIENAQTQVDDALREVYEVPFNPVPAAIKYLVRDIAVYLCDLTYRRSRSYELDANPHRLRYRRAEQLLQTYRTELIDLDAPKLSGDGHEPVVIQPYEGILFTPEQIWGPAPHA
jgi:phage gp36-like protein